MIRFSRAADLLEYDLVPFSLDHDLDSERFPVAGEPLVQNALF